MPADGLAAGNVRDGHRHRRGVHSSIVEAATGGDTPLQASSQGRVETMRPRRIVNLHDGYVCAALVLAGGFGRDPELYDG